MPTTTPDTRPKETGLDVAIRTADVADRWSRDQVNLLLKEYAAKGTTVEEFSAFLIIAKNLHLDPFLHEIWLPDFDGTGRDRAPYVGRDGLLAIAERSGQFDGMVSGTVRAGDRFQFGLMEPVHEFPDDVAARGDIIGGYAYVYRKDRRYPFRLYAEWADFGYDKTRNPDGTLKTGPVTKTPWFRYPSLQIKKCAEANALRLAFKVSGVIAVADNATPLDARDDADVIDGEAVEVIEAEPESTPRSAASSEDAPAAHRRDEAGSAQPADEPSGEHHLFDATPDDGQHRDPA